MKCRLLLDVVVGERAAVLKLLAREDEALLVRGNALLVCVVLALVFQQHHKQHTLNLALHVVNSV
jgi:hypothetical protein